MRAGVKTIQKKKWRDSSLRLPHQDYGSQDFYFVTLCTKKRRQFFGHITMDPPPTMHFTEIGHIAHQYWSDIPLHFPFVERYEFVIMPDHVHGLFFNKRYSSDFSPNAFGPQSMNLGSVIRGFKAATKKYAIMNNIDFAWQARYYDHIVTTRRELLNIRNYI